MADFDLLKVKVTNRFFSILEKEHPLTKRCRLRYCASKSVQPFWLGACLRAYKVKKKKKAQTLICWVYVSQSLKIFPKPNFARLFRSMT